MLIKKKGFRNNIHHYLMLFPFFLFFSLFFLWPMIYGAVLSLTKWDGVNPAVFVGLKNFVKVIKSSKFEKGMLNLLKYIIIAIPLNIMAAFGVAVLVDSFKKVKHNFFRAIYFLPFVIPLFLGALIWRWMFTPEYGIINVIIMKLGGESLRWLTSPDYMIFAVIIVDFWRSLGFNMILILGGLKAISKDYYEAAHIDGASSSQITLRITLPLLEPVLFLVVVNAFISVIQMFDVPWLLSRSDYYSQGGPAQGMLFPVMDILGRAFGRLKFGEASAYAFILLTLTMVVTLFQFVIRKRYKDR